MVVSHSSTARLTIWSGKLKDSLKQDQTYLFPPLEQIFFLSFYLFICLFFWEKEICMNKKTVWSSLKILSVIYRMLIIRWAYCSINEVLQLCVCVCARVFAYLT